MLCEVEYQKHDDTSTDNEACKPLELTFYDIQTSKCNSEADLLLDSSKTCDSSEGNMLQIEEHSPLLVGTERSPLLDANNRFVCDSTSEETLSDRDDPSDDIDKLLSGVHVHEGSFASLFSSELVLPTLNPVLPRSHINNAASFKPRRKVSVEYVASTCSPRLSESSSSTGGYQPLSPTSVGVGNMDTFPMNSSQPPHSLRSTPPQQRQLIALPLFGADGNVPDICIHSHQPSSHCHAPSCSSSNSSINSTNSPKTQILSADRHLVDDRPEHTEQSAHSSIDMSPVSPPEELPLADMMQKRADFDSVTKFQRYLRTRGLELDLSTVQSSDV